MRLTAHVLFPLISLITGLTTTAAAQALQPLPAGISVAERDDAPVTIKLNGVNAVSRDRSALNYTVTNVAARNIRALVVTGVPGTVKYAAVFGAGLRPGATETFSVGNLLEKKARPYREIMVDFVLFDDGSTWGPNATGDGDYLTGVYEGRKAAYADAASLVETHVEQDVTVWLRSPDVQRTPPGYTRILNTKWREGYVYGYAGAHETFKRDFARRGLFSMGLRLEAMQRDLGITSSTAAVRTP